MLSWSSSEAAFRMSDIFALDGTPRVTYSGYRAGGGAPRLVDPFCVINCMSQSFRTYDRAT